jgi:hypothetical protein
VTVTQTTLTTNQRARTAATKYPALHHQTT